MPKYKKSSRINFGRLLKQLNTTQEQLGFLQEHGVLPKSKSCESCDQNLTTVNSNGKGYHYFFCSNCKKKYSVRNKTILSLAHISLRKFVLLVYFFITSFLSYKQVKKEVSVSSSSSGDDSGDEDDHTGVGLSNRTISRYYSLFRDIIGEEMLTNNRNKKIGGPNLTVEIDESMFGKRKHHRGTIIGRRQLWVLGGVCRETKEVFLVPCPNNKRDKPTLEKIILENVEKGTLIYTDGWKAYQNIEKLGYRWDWVNHSTNFVKPGNADVHTNTIEGRWQCVKRQLPECGKYDLESHLPVYLWKQYCNRNNLVHFWEMLRIIAVHQNHIFDIGDDDTETDEEQNDSDVNEKVATCVFCGRDFKNDRGLKTHLRTCSEK